MCNFTPSGFIGEGSPDRADALVWALTELMLSTEPQPGKAKTTTTMGAY